MAILKPQSHTAEFLGRFRGLSALGFGLSIGEASAPSRAAEFEPLSEAEDDQVWDLLKEFEKTGLRLRIVVDDPDRFFSNGPNADPHLLAGYILGTNSIAERLNYVQFVHILKNNVFESLSGIEEISNLPHDYFSYISWSEEELMEVVDERMKYAKVSDKEVFSDDRAAVLETMIDQLRNGPRDLLRYAEIVMKKGNTSRLSLEITGGVRVRLQAFRTATDEGGL